MIADSATPSEPQQQPDPWTTLSPRSRLNAISAGEFRNIYELRDRLVRSVKFLAGGLDQKLKDELAAVAWSGVQNALSRHQVYELAARGSEDHRLFPDIPQPRAELLDTTMDEVVEHYREIKDGLPPGQATGFLTMPFEVVASVLESRKLGQQVGVCDCGLSDSRITRSQLRGQIDACTRAMTDGELEYWSDFLSTIEQLRSGTPAEPDNGEPDTELSEFVELWRRLETPAREGLVNAARRIAGKPAAPRVNDDSPAREPAPNKRPDTESESDVNSVSRSEALREIMRLHNAMKTKDLIGSVKAQRDYLEQYPEELITALDVDDDDSRSALRAALDEYDGSAGGWNPTPDKVVITGNFAAEESDYCAVDTVTPRQAVADFNDSLEYTIGQRFEYDKPEAGEVLHVCIDQNNDGNLMLVDVMDHSFDRENLRTYSTKISVKELKALGLGDLRPYGEDFTVTAVLERLNPNERRDEIDKRDTADNERADGGTKTEAHVLEMAARINHWNGSRDVPEYSATLDRALSTCRKMSPAEVEAVHEFLHTVFAEYHELAIEV